MQLFKAVPPSGVTRGALDWNVPTGTVIRCDHNVADPDHGDVCPQHEGDGISVAKTWAGAAQAGFPTVRCCAVTVDPADILAEDDHKVRARAVTVGEWFDAAELLRQGWGDARAYLSGAYLSGAYLYGADLYGADLRRAYLSGADLRRADLSGADLSRVNLSEANLSRANLSGADLSEANLSRVNLSRVNLRRADLSRVNLSGADLRRADLSGADLSGAALYGADLSGAYLSGADLYGANLWEWERGDNGYARRTKEN